LDYPNISLPSHIPVLPVTEDHHHLTGFIRKSVSMSVPYIQSSSHILKLAGWGSGERWRKREVQGVKLVSVLWHEMSLKNTAQNTLAARTIGDFCSM